MTDAAAPSPPRTVALFGGSFNPPHVAHQMVCLFVLETEAVDAVWMTPTYKHAFAKNLASFDDRIAMCELAATAFHGRVVVSRIEETVAQRPGFTVSRTLHTLEALHAEYPNTTFRMVVGADILAERDKWYRWDEVVRLAPLIVVGRGGHALPAGSTELALDMPAVSSTEVRARIGRGESAVPLVPRSVMEYIGRRGLYR
jgi:nicotinate-nucleotide adenylyltransferase